MSTRQFSLSPRGYTRAVCVTNVAALAGCITLALIDYCCPELPWRDLVVYLIVWAVPIAVVGALVALARLRDAGIPVLPQALVVVAMLVIAAYAVFHGVHGYNSGLEHIVCGIALAQPFLWSLHFIRSEPATAQSAMRNQVRALRLVYGAVCGGIVVLWFNVSIQLIATPFREPAPPAFWALAWVVATLGSFWVGSVEGHVSGRVRFCSWRGWAIGSLVLLQTLVAGVSVSVFVLVLPRSELYLIAGFQWGITGLSSLSLLHLIPKPVHGTVTPEPRVATTSVRGRRTFGRKVVPA